MILSDLCNAWSDRRVCWAGSCLQSVPEKILVLKLITVINNGVTHTSPYIPIYPTSEKPFPTISLFINFVGYTILVWDIYNIISRYDLKKYILRQFRWIVRSVYNNIILYVVSVSKFSSILLKVQNLEEHSINRFYFLFYSYFHVFKLFYLWKKR